MKRRDFITVLGAAVAWPLAARAQQPRLPVIGFLSSLAPGDADLILPAFREGLNGIGFVEGRSVLIEYRWAAGDYHRLPALAADLMRRKVGVIAAISGTPAALAAKAATTTIPIVFAIGGDPIAPGLVSNLSHPGSNITGVSFYTSPVVTKQLDLARELIAKGSTIAMFVNPDNPPNVREGSAVQEAAAAVGQPLRILHVSTPPQIDEAFASFERERPGALIISSDPFFFTERVKLVVLMSRHALPTIFADREQVDAGGLMSYGMPSTMRRMNMRRSSAEPEIAFSHPAPIQAATTAPVAMARVSATNGARLTVGKAKKRVGTAARMVRRELARLSGTAR